MDALHDRGLVRGRDLELDGGTIAGRGTGRRPLLGRTWLSAALAAIGLLVAAWFNLVELPLAIVVTGPTDGEVVASVAPGSEGWIDGVRAEMEVERLENGTMQVVVEDGHAFGFQPHLQGDFMQDVLVGAAIIVGAALFGAARLPGAAAAAGVGVAFAIGPGLPHLGLPAAIPLVMLSVATVATAVRIPDRRKQRRFDVFSIGVLVTLGAICASLMTVDDPIKWDYVWAAPFVVALCLGVIGELVAIQSRMAVSPEIGQSRSMRLLHAIVPLAARSRLEGAEEERSRMAIELHNSVIPRLSSSARAIRNETASDTAADGLEVLAEELRGVVERHETVTLESGGVGEGLRAHLEKLSTFGIRVSFDVRDDERGRPPARVELAAYRIGQAAIDNALRHSGGESVDVFVSSARDRLELVVKDDGIGIGDNAEENARRQGRIGLAQMWLRAEAVGGSLDIRSHADQGTDVSFRWAA